MSIHRATSSYNSSSDEKPGQITIFPESSSAPATRHDFDFKASDPHFAAAAAHFGLNPARLIGFGEDHTTGVKMWRFAGGAKLTRTGTTAQGYSWSMEKTIRESSYT